MRCSIVSRALYVFLVLVVFSALHDAASAEDVIEVDVHISTSTSTFHASRNENGQPKGDWVNKIRAFMEPRGVRPNIIFYPFPRSLIELEDASHVLLAHLDRVPTREDKYLWVLPLADKTYSIVARDEPAYQNLSREDWMAYEGTTGCIIQSYQCDLLRRSGYPETKILSPGSSTGVTLPPMLAHRRFDFIIADMPWRDGRHVEWEGTELVRLFDFETITTYVGGGLNLDPEVRRRLMPDSLNDPVN